MVDNRSQSHEKKTRAWAKCSACRQRKGKVRGPQRYKKLSLIVLETTVVQPYNSRLEQ